METVPDRIEKTVVLQAPRPRVWRAISDARQFGTWFGVAFDAPFVAGERITGRIAPTQVDAEVAALQAPHAGQRFDITVVEMVPERRFAFRWHPYAVDPEPRDDDEPTTLVVFELDDVPGGTRLTVSESGFANIPLARRAAAFTANDEGWTHQMRLVAAYLRGHA